MSETRSQQPQPTTGSSTQSQSARSQSHLEKTSDHPIVSETGSKQQQLTTGSLTQSLPAKSQSHSEKASDHNEQIAEIGKQFLDVPTSKVHHYLLCTQRNCTDISKEEHSRIKTERNREKFHHSWLGNKSVSFWQQTAIFWPVYIEGQGFYCFLCKKHQTTNTQNKESKFTLEPAVRIKEQTLKSHLDCSAHQRGVSGELLNRVTVLFSASIRPRCRSCR